VRRALAAGLSIVALVAGLAVLTAPGAAARAPNAAVANAIVPTVIAPNATAATGATCYVAAGTCSEVPCVYMITAGQATAMSAGPQLALPARPARSRCVHPPSTGPATIVERPKTATAVPRFGALLAPAVFRGSLAQRIVALRHAVMSSPGALGTP